MKDEGVCKSEPLFAFFAKHTARKFTKTRTLIRTHLGTKPFPCMLPGTCEWVSREPFKVLNGSLNRLLDLRVKFDVKQHPVRFLVALLSNS